LHFIKMAGLWAYEAGGRAFSGGGNKKAALQ
jgi:hypothetical protein